MRAILMAALLLGCGESDPTGTDQPDPADTDTDDCPAEVCGNGLDDDCDGSVDLADTDCQVEGVVMRATFVHNTGGAEFGAVTPDPSGGVWASVAGYGFDESELTELGTFDGPAALVRLHQGQAVDAAEIPLIGSSLTTVGSEPVLTAGYREPTSWGETELPGPSRDLAFALAWLGTEGAPRQVVRLDSSQDVEVWGAAALPDGGLVAVGNMLPDMTMVASDGSTRTASGFNHLYLARWSAGGAIESLHTIEGTLSNDRGGDRLIASDGAGNVFVGGQTFGTFASFIDEDGSAIPVVADRKLDAFVARLSPSGVTAWLLQVTSSEDDSIHEVAATPDGGACITGQAWHTITIGAGRDDALVFPGQGPRAFVVRVDASGQVLWADVAQSATDAATWVNAPAAGVVAMPDGGCTMYLGIDGLGSRGGPVSLRRGQADEATFAVGTDWDDVVIARYKADGALAWARQYSGESRTEATAIALGADGLIYVTGRHLDTFSVETVDGVGTSEAADKSAGFVLAVVP